MLQTGSADGNPTHGVNIDTALLDSDVGNWTVTVTDSLRIDIVKRGPEYFQNRECPFESVQRTATNVKGLNRQLTTNCFYKQLLEWRRTFKKMVVILHQRKVCFACVLNYFIQAKKQLTHKNSLQDFETGGN